MSLLSWWRSRRLARLTAAAARWKAQRNDALAAGLVLARVTAVRQHARTGTKAYVVPLEVPGALAEAVWCKAQHVAAGQVVAYRGRIVSARVLAPRRGLRVRRAWGPARSGPRCL